MTADMLTEGALFSLVFLAREVTRFMLKTSPPDNATAIKIMGERLERTMCADEDLWCHFLKPDQSKILNPGSWDLFSDQFVDSVGRFVQRGLIAGPPAQVAPPAPPAPSPPAPAPLLIEPPGPARPGPPLLIGPPPSQVPTPPRAFERLLASLQSQTTNLEPMLGEDVTVYLIKGLMLLWMAISLLHLYRALALHAGIYYREWRRGPVIEELSRLFLEFVPCVHVAVGTAEPTHAGSSHASGRKALLCSECVAFLNKYPGKL